MAPTHPSLHLGVTLGGLGSHPRAWRLSPGSARSWFRADYHLRLARAAEEAALDLIYLEDAYALQSDDDRDLRGRLDAALLASRLAPATSGIGLVPEFTVTHAEPFHISKSVATLDHASLGRAGWAITTAGASDRLADQQNDHFGRRPVLSEQAAYAEAADVAEVVGRLFDSWEDEAEIRDLSTGRFVDRDKLHYVDFIGDFFSVKGPSITPRPPQGRPPTVVPVRTEQAIPLAGRYAEIAIVRADDLAAAGALSERIRTEAERAGRAASIRVLVEFDVLLGRTDDQLTELKAVLDQDLQDPPQPRGIGFAGTPAGLADVLAGLDADLDGALINFAALPSGLAGFTQGVLPELVARGRFRDRYRSSTLRERFGLPHPTNIYATA